VGREQARRKDQVRARFSSLRDPLWALDPYGVADHKREDPSEYDDWASDIDRSLRRDVNVRPIVEMLRKRYVEDVGVVPPKLEETVMQNWDIIRRNYE
jgi:hypothetical protein